MDERGYISVWGKENHWAVIYNQYQFTGIFDTLSAIFEKSRPKLFVVQTLPYRKKKSYEEDWNIKPRNWFIDLLKVFWLAFVGLLKGNLKK